MDLTEGGPAAAGTTGCIDVHAHLVDRHYLDELTDVMGLVVSRTEDGQTLMRQENTTVAWTRDHFFDPAARLREMDAKGVDIRIISLSSPGIMEWKGEAQVRMARHVNDATARLCAADPTRYRGLAALPLDDVSVALAELGRALDELGLVGVAIGSHIGGKPLNHPDFEPLWAFVNARRLPVVQHPMLPLGAEHLDEFELPLRVGFIYETTTALTRMIYGGVFERYPDFPFIVAHTGGALLPLLERLDNGFRLFPDCRKNIDRLPSEYAKRLYYDTCAFFAPTIMMAHEIVGPAQLLWGSDDPYIGAGTGYVEKLPLSDADKAMILGGNAARLFGITQ